MRENRNLLVHVDVDSPGKLISFYRLRNIAFDRQDLERFYVKAFQRKLEFFDKHEISATFFVVADEVENSPVIQKVIADAHQAGHEIENHTFSHPYGLCTMNDAEIEREVEGCNNVISSVTGIRPIGFRSPGYSMSSRVMNILRDCGMKYDSSGSWSVFNSVYKATHKLFFKNGLSNPGFGEVTRQMPREPYYPDKADWQKKSGPGTLLELPLPRTSALLLPFYNNFNLWAPELYGRIVSATMKQRTLVYLFHSIEFMDASDGVPKDLLVHPNLKKPASLKIRRSGKIIENLRSRYQSIPTRGYLALMSNKFA